MRIMLLVLAVLALLPVGIIGLTIFGVLMDRVARKKHGIRHVHHHW